MHFGKADKFARYRTALTINSVVAVLQFTVLFVFANSLSLYGDAMHSLSDILILSGTTLVMGRELRAPDRDHTGAKKWLTRIAVLLLFASAVHIVIEAYERILTPVPFSGWPVALIALLSVIGNWLAHRTIADIETSERDHVHEANIAHLLTDLGMSLVVLISSVLVIFFGLPAIDAWFSLLVAVWMVWWGIKILKGGDTHGHVHAHSHDHDKDKHLHK